MHGLSRYVEALVHERPDASSRDVRVCHGTLNTFITASPRWLITFTAIRPLVGLSKGRDVSLFSVAQASSPSGGAKSGRADCRARWGAVRPGYPSH